MLHTSCTIFTDGSSRGNPGPGGFAAIVVYRDDSLIHADKTRINADSTEVHIREIGGREEHTTNNRMELRAAIEGLKGLTLNREKGQTLKVVIYTDSSYLINGITKWVHGWQQNGWKTKARQDVENKDLWEKLIEISRNKKIQWKQVKGHAGVAGNQRCDEIATAFADNLPPKLYADVLKNYSIENILDVPRGLPRTDLSADPRSVLGRQKKRSRSRAAAYSYVSMVGGVVQIHKTWAECEKRVKGRRARYKKVFSPEEEHLLVAGWSK